MHRVAEQAPSPWVVRAPGAVAQGRWPARFLLAGATGLALALLAATLAWQVPMMLWDHLDLLPMYQAWREGRLGSSAFFDVHGGHLHTAAYAVLLATTALSGGQPWLDGLASWLLLVGWALVVLAMARRSGIDALATERVGRAWLVLLVLLVLHPGHLANLQWGWQVAVFLCLAAVASALWLLACAAPLRWSGNLLALLCAAIACYSFATGLAVLPAALVLIALQSGRGIAARAALALPWVLLGGWLVLRHAHGTDGGQPDPIVSLAYGANYLGAGLARYATDVAAALAAAALLLLVACVRGDWRHPAYRPWLGLLLFGAGCAFATALGRAGPFGSEHAFASRYLSFSLAFWVGWAGMLAVAAQRMRWQRGRSMLAAAALVLSTFNGVHMARQAWAVSVASGQAAREIACTWPDVAPGLLGDIYFGDVPRAQSRLAMLHRLEFPPFSGEQAVPCPPAPA